MSILSFALHGDTTERMTAWERSLLTLPEPQQKTHLLMRVGTLLRSGQMSEERLVRFLERLPQPQAQPTPTDIGAPSKRN